MPFIFHQLSQLGTMYANVFKNYGYHHEFYLHKYKPNPFWTPEENKRFRHLGNLERYGKWRPPGVYKAKMTWSKYGTTWHERERFMYENRPSPKDTLQRSEQWRWKTTSTTRAVHKLVYGLGTGVVVYSVYFFSKSVLGSMAAGKGEAAHGNH